MVAYSLAIDANAEFQTLVRRYLRISSDDVALNFDRTSDCVHDARKLGEDAIACRVGDVPAVPLDASQAILPTRYSYAHPRFAGYSQAACLRSPDLLTRTSTNMVNAQNGNPAAHKRRLFKTLILCRDYQPIALMTNQEQELVAQNLLKL